MHFYPDTGLEQVRDMLLIGFSWDDEYAPVFITENGPITPDDDDFYDEDLATFLRRTGDTLTFALEAPGEPEVVLELVELSLENDTSPLPRFVDGQHASPPIPPETGEDMLPIPFDLTALNDEAKELFDEGEELNYVLESLATQGYDLDELQQALQNFAPEDLVDEPLDYEWLAETHGIKLSHENVHNVPQEIFDFFAQSDPDDPTVHEADIKALRQKYPDNPHLAEALLTIYAVQGNQAGGRRLIAEMREKHPKNALLIANNLLAIEDEDKFIAETSRQPQPLDIRNYDAGNDGYYHLEEFVLFEQVAIRYYLGNNRLAEAINRLDRLVRLGLVYLDLEPSAVAVGGILNLTSFDEDFARDQIGDWEAALDQAATRTLEIIEFGGEEAMAAFEQMVEEEEPQATVRRIGKKIGRNDPCPCGSGRKYKKCCL